MTVPMARIAIPNSTRRGVIRSRRLREIVGVGEGVAVFVGRAFGVLVARGVGVLRGRRVGVAVAVGVEDGVSEGAAVVVVVAVADAVGEAVGVSVAAATRPGVEAVPMNRGAEASTSATSPDTAPTARPGFINRRNGFLRES